MVAALLSALTPLVPLPPGSAVLIERSTLTSEDGKHAVQLATFGFPMSKEDGRLLMTVMNSDPYWHHFRTRTVHLTVGKEVFTGGPRLTAWGWPGLLPRHGPPPRFGWTTAFVLPADVKLTGELKFSYGDGNSKPAAEPFAKLELTEKNVRAVTVPFRVTIQETGKFKDALDGNREVHFVIFEPNHVLLFEDLRLGEVKARRFPYEVPVSARKNRRAQLNEFVATFEDAPPTGASARLKVRGNEGWYKAETVTAKPKEKQ